MKYFFALLFIAGMAGCTAGDMEKLQSLGSEHKVELYSGGQLVRSWTSTGKVLNGRSDGYYFEDAETGCLIEISGNVVITRIEE